MPQTHPDAMLALATTHPGTLAMPITDMQAGAADEVRPPSRALLGSIAPALDLAFGIDDVSAFPDDIVELVGRLQAGPLGRRPASRIGRPDTMPIMIPILPPPISPPAMSPPPGYGAEAGAAMAGT